MKQEEYKPTLRDVGRLKFGKENRKRWNCWIQKSGFQKEKMAPKEKKASSKSEGQEICHCGKEDQ
eukprot:TRINITY_DN494_c1_g1_i1.p3 TRINITY_DN494_c1_g1~~TRINITY_DN494_c1_g1_i1.p3  ORF type:complete len:65 (-),score=17.53 TRINITY_DN494_c1_g1_i1:85-279(-)